MPDVKLTICLLAEAHKRIAGFEDALDGTEAALAATA